MKDRLLALAISLAILTAVAVNQNAAAQADARSQERIAREVRHELLMLPWFGAFDYIAFKVDGGTVTLMGQVVRPSLKSEAENAVKAIEGGERAKKKSEVTPPPPVMVLWPNSWLAGGFTSATSSFRPHTEVSQEVFADRLRICCGSHRSNC